MINPLALGAGRTLFEGIREPLAFTLVGSRSFRNGKVVLTYVPRTQRDAEKGFGGPPAT